MAVLCYDVLILQYQREVLDPEKNCLTPIVGLKQVAKVERRNKPTPTKRWGIITLTILNFV